MLDAIADAPGATAFGRFRDSVNPYLGDLLERMRLDASFVGGQGCRLLDDRGRSVLDFVAGYGALPFGHNPPAILAALTAAIASGNPTMVQPMMAGSAGLLAERLLAVAPGAFNRVLFANSGAEAVEAALKACRMATGRERIVAMQRGFHGKTMGSMGVTDMRGRDSWQGPEAARGALLPFGDIDALADDLTAFGDRTAAVILELVQGEGGVHVAPDGYARAARELCDRHGVLLIIDEVQTGLGRTGALFATAAAGIQADCIALSKGLGGGVLPVGACLVGPRADSRMLGLQHSSTFAGNALACAAGVATLDLLAADDGAMLRNVRERGEQLQAIHRRLADDFPNTVVDHRGRGLLLGVQLRARADGRSWGRTLEVLSDQGHLCVLLASHLLNAHGIRVAPTLRAASVLRVEPPLIVEAADCATYERAMRETLALVEAGDTAALVGRHGGGSAGNPPRSTRDARVDEPIAPARDEGRFAFLVHPLAARGLADFDEALRAMSDGELDEVTGSVVELVDPFHVARCRFAGADGKTAIGDFIVVPRTADQLARMDRAEAVGLVQAAVDIAVDRGARIVGLGGFTSIVTSGGTAIDGRGAGLTTGNSFTVVAAMQAISQATLRLGLSLPRCTGGIVGATGLIGGAAIALLGARCGDLVLLCNPQSPMAKTRRRLHGHLANAIAAWIDGECPPDPGSLGETLLRHPRCPPATADRAAIEAFARWLLEPDRQQWIVVSLDGGDLARCAVAVVATSSTEAFIEPSMVKPGAVICDLSRPANTSRRLIDERPDILVIDGGTIAFPGRPDMGFEFGLPRGIGYACMAEATMLGLERQSANASYGAHLSLGECRRIERLAERHGFALSGLRSLDQPLTRMDWRRLMTAAAGAADANAQPRDPIGSAAVTASAPALVDLPADAVVDLHERLVGRHLAAGSGDRPAVVDASGVATSYAELDRASAAIAAGLASRGVVAGDRVALSGRDDAGMVAAMLAAWRLGASLVPLNPATDAATMRDLCSVVGARLVLDCGLEAPTATALRQAGLSPVTLATLLACMDRPPLSMPRPLSTGAVCLFTSGSTGRPKAVEHSVGDLATINLNYSAALLALRPQDRVAVTSRLFFAYAFNILQMTLWAGAALLLADDRFDADATLARLERERPTLLFSVPTVYLLLLRRCSRPHDLGSLRLCVSAGEPLPVDVFDAWSDRYALAILDGLGTTEALSTFLSNDPARPTPGCTGRVVPGFDVRLVTEDGALARPGEIGQLWVRGNTVARGYLNDGSGGAFADGWVCTGDLMHHDADERFHYVGRANDMIKTGGVWTSPLEIEATLREHPAVLECAVVARRELGLLARPEAFVVTAGDVRGDDRLANELRQHARRRLLPGRAPHFVTFVDALPKTATQKIQRFKLREGVAPA